MTVGAACHVGLRVVDGAGLGDTMAKDTGGGLIRHEEIVSDSTMRHMAMATILDHRCVLEHPRAALGLMAFGALFGLAVQAISAGFVWAMAIRAAEHALTDRMV